MNFPMKMVSSEVLFTRGTFDGVVVYPELVFPGEVSLTLFDGRRFIPTHWELAFFPIQDSLRVDDEDGLVFLLTVTKNSGLVWKHAVTHKGEREVYSYLSAFGLPSLKSTLPD
ncbi:MAG: hypothetical protein GY697_09905 [Desulfobacterales bacterium]|nr:hypothetical protein [Desulfobacterales bacterium]